MDAAITTPCDMKTVIDSSHVSKYFEFNKWGFLSVVSARAFELYMGAYPPLRMTNETYCIIGESVEAVTDEFTETLKGLATAAKNKKLEGFAVGEGTLIFQNRRPVEIAEREDGKFQLYWRGKLDRISPEYNAIALDPFDAN